MSEKRTGRGGLLAEDLFSTLFSVCVDVYISIMHSAQLMIDSRSHGTSLYGWLKCQQEKEFPSSSASHAVLCLLGCMRATLMYSMCSSRFPFLK